MPTRRARTASLNKENCARKHFSTAAQFEQNGITLLSCCRFVFDVLLHFHCGSAPVVFCAVNFFSRLKYVCVHVVGCVVVLLIRFQFHFKWLDTIFGSFHIFSGFALVLLFSFSPSRLLLAH